MMIFVLSNDCVKSLAMYTIAFLVWWMILSGCYRRVLEMKANGVLYHQYYSISAIISALLQGVNNK